jgi:hypothetical protein
MSGVVMVAVRPVHQAEAAQYDWEKGRLTLRRWRVYEFTYVVDNKNDLPIDHFYLEVPALPLRAQHHFHDTDLISCLHITAPEEGVGADRDGGSR